MTVASEPDDDRPGWTEVPDRHLLSATARGVRICPLTAVPSPASPGGGQPDQLAAPTADDHVYRR